MGIDMKPILKEPKWNKTERRYAQTVLEGLRLSGEILEWRYEPLNFRMADNTYYRPDFLLIYETHFEIVEIKGFLRDDAHVKFKTCAALYPWFKWRMIFYNKRQGFYEKQEY